MPEAVAPLRARDGATVVALADPGLDRWPAEFHHRNPARRGAVHGADGHDYHRRRVRAFFDLRP
ncbi:hypothetical protein [Actinomadura geliboluensis]|uniref:hypothetical protein n=1 Tax=Actinomadura geliboluensis TaxID=882440 RepID=UPI00371B163B